MELKIDVLGQSIVLGLQPPHVRPYTAYGLPHNPPHPTQVAV